MADDDVLKGVPTMPMWACAQCRLGLNSELAMIVRGTSLHVKCEPAWANAHRPIAGLPPDHPLQPKVDTVSRETSPGVSPRPSDYTDGWADASRAIIAMLDRKRAEIAHRIVQPMTLLGEITGDIEQGEHRRFT